MNKSSMFKLILILLLTAIIVYFIAWLVFVKSGFFPVSIELSRSDWMELYSNIITLFGTLFLGSITYMQNISLQKANERFERANLNILEQNLKLNGFSSISIELITIESNEINLFFKSTGKFHPTFINIIKIEQETGDGSKKQLLSFFKSQGIYRETKEYDGYFSLSIDEGYIKKIKEIPLNHDHRNISPNSNLVLWIDYELRNAFGVISKISEKLIASKTDNKGFVKNCEFVTSIEISVINNVD